jgi:NADH dehydrogenase
VVGGTGFVGSHLLPSLLSAGHEIRVVGRGVRSASLVPGLLPTFGDVVSGEGLEEAFQSADAVVNLAAVIRQRGNQTFDAVNARGTANVVAAATRAGVRRMVQFSAIGADPDPSFPYLFSKWEGEQALAASSLEWVVVRSSVIFGEGQGFFTQLAKALSLPSPFLVIPGDGSAVFQPISADDVARCLLMAVEEESWGRHLYEIGGPEQPTLEEIIFAIAEAIGKERFGGSKRKPFHLGLRLIQPAAMVMDKVLRDPLVTPQQLDMLARPNITRLDAVRCDFGFEPRPMRSSLGYLKRPGRRRRLAA